MAAAPDSSYPEDPSDPMPSQHSRTVAGRAHHRRTEAGAMAASVPPPAHQFAGTSPCSSLIASDVRRPCSMFRSGWRDPAHEQAEKIALFS